MTEVCVLKSGTYEYVCVYVFATNIYIYFLVIFSNTCLFQIFPILPGAINGNWYISGKDLEDIGKCEMCSHIHVVIKCDVTRLLTLGIDLILIFLFL